MAKPTILLVEDRKPLLDQMAKKLDARGARVIPRRSFKEAMAAFRRRPSEISALLTDIRLSESNPRDRGGFSLAETLSAITPTLPLFGYTGNNDIRDVDQVLDALYEKTLPEIHNPRGIDNNLDTIVQRAAEYDRDRYRSVPDELLAIKEKYAIADPDFARLLSGWRVGDLDRLAEIVWPSEARMPEEGATPDKCVVRFIRVGTLVEGTRVRANIAVIVRPLSAIFQAQLFGLPIIYTIAETEDDAVAEMAAYLYECHRDMGRADDFLDTGNGGDIIRFRSFLNRAFMGAQ